MEKIENLFAFDFDDTLAITPSIIGVQRIDLNGNSDPTFREWIYNHDLDFDEIENEDSSNEIIWFSSGDFAKYEKAHREDLKYIESNSLEDKYDFTKTASVDVDGSSPIESILSLLKNAKSESNSRVVIITARSGKEPMHSLSIGGSINPTNRQDIKDFLNGQGINLNSANITTAGDIGTGPQAKVKAMEKYIEMYNPSNIFFYDDNQRNIEAIAGMCEKYFPGINIKTFKVDNSGNITLSGGCW